MRFALAIFCFSAGVAALRADSTPLPIGADFQINSYTTNSQRYPAVTTDADGNFVVVWDSYGSSGAGGWSAQGQRFSGAGVPLGAQFQVNSLTPISEAYTAIATGADGDFVVVWSGFTSTGDFLTRNVLAQRWSATGVPQGALFRVNTYTPNIQSLPAIAADADGDFVVVWQSNGSSGGDTSGYSVQGQRYSAAGAPQGAQFQVNSYTSGGQDVPAIAADAGGNFVVVWESTGSSGGDTSLDSVQAQRYSAAGVPQGSQFQVNGYTTSSQRQPAVASDAAGSFVVVWSSNGASGGDTEGYSVQAQRYSPAGTPQGTQFQVNSYTTYGQHEPAISTDADGDFIVVWRSDISSAGDPSDVSIEGQRFSAAGAPLGAQFQVNSDTLGLQFHPAIATDANGDFVVVWDSDTSTGGDTDSQSIQGRRFRVTGDLQGRVFLDRDADGIQDGGEPGVAGIAVELYDETATLRRTAVTNNSGGYSLKPKDGSWTAKFVLPSNGFHFTTQNAGGDDTLDSDADPTTGETEPFSISIAVLDDTVDAGFLPLIFADGFETGATAAWSATAP